MVKPVFVDHGTDWQEDGPGAVKLSNSHRLGDDVQSWVVPEGHCVHHDMSKRLGDNVLNDGSVDNREAGKSSTLDQAIPEVLTGRKCSLEVNNCIKLLAKGPIFHLQKGTFVQFTKVCNTS